MSFFIFDTTVPEGTPLSLLLVRWGSLFFSCFILYSPTTADRDTRDTIYVFHLMPVQGDGLPPRQPDLFTL